MLRAVWRVRTHEVLGQEIYLLFVAGWTIEETANKLMKESAKAQERARVNNEGYALITAQNAAVAAERSTQSDLTGIFCTR